MSRGFTGRPEKIPADFRQSGETEAESEGPCPGAVETAGLAQPETQHEAGHGYENELDDVLHRRVGCGMALRLRDFGGFRRSRDEA